MKNEKGCRKNPSREIIWFPQIFIGGFALVFIGLILIGKSQFVWEKVFGYFLLVPGFTIIYQSFEMEKKS